MPMSTYLFVEENVEQQYEQPLESNNKHGCSNSNVFMAIGNDMDFYNSFPTSTRLNDVTQTKQLQ